MAIVAAVLFGLALIFQLAGVSLEIITASVLTTTGFLCLALHLAGVPKAGSFRGRSWRRRR